MVSGLNFNWVKKLRIQRKLIVTFWILPKLNWIKQFRVIRNMYLYIFAKLVSKAYLYIWLQFTSERNTTGSKTIAFITSHTNYEYIRGRLNLDNGLFLLGSLHNNLLQLQNAFLFEYIICKLILSIHMYGFF